VGIVPQAQRREPRSENEIVKEDAASSENGMNFIAITAHHSKLRKVRRALRRNGVNAYLPAIVHKRTIPKAGKVIHKRRVTPLMSYILAEIPDHSAAQDLWLHSILETKDVKGYVKNNDRPALIPGAHVEDLRSSVAKIRRELAAQNHKRWLRTGSKVSIKNGSLAGKVGTVQWLKGKRVGLEAKLFGSTRVVEVTKDNLEHAA
jgi:transcription antitermination factor NusG